MFDVKFFAVADAVNVGVRVGATSTLASVVCDNSGQSGSSDASLFVSLNELSVAFADAVLIYECISSTATTDRISADAG